MNIRDAIEDILSRIDVQYPQLIYVGKNYTTKDLRDALVKIQELSEGRQK